MNATGMRAARQTTLGGTVMHTLHPGDVACGNQGDRLETLLGSCVAIILTDPRRTVGAMSHIVHSRPAPRASSGDTAYAEVALARMFAVLRARGIAPQLCEAYVFGGGNMFPTLVRQSHVGDANARWAVDTLAHEGIRVLQQDIGGAAYRRVGWTIGPADPQVTSVPV